MKNRSCSGWVVLLGLLGLGAGYAYAAGSTGAEFLQVQVPAAVAAQTAGVADRGGLGSLAWNPAGILGGEYPEVAMTHVASLADTAYEQLDSVVPHVGGGSLGLGVFYSGNYGLMEMDASGEAVGNLQNSNMLGHVSYARPLFEGLDAGVTLKLFQSTLGSYTSKGMAMDLGVRQRLSGLPLALGGVVKNLGSMTAFDQEADPLPTVASMGVQILGDDWGARGLKLCSDWNWPLQGETLSYATLGAEYGVMDLGFVRAGYRLDNELGAFSVGGGVRWSGLGVDYAFQPYGTLGSNHRLTVSYSFKPLASGLQPVTPAESVVPKLNSPIPAGGGEVVSLEKAYSAQGTLRPLTFETRRLEGQMVFRHAFAESAGILGVRILDAQSHVVRDLPKTMAAGEWVWDGRNDQGERVLETSAFFVAPYTQRGQDAAVPLPQLAPVLKLAPADGSTVFVKSVFRFLHRPVTQSWTLVLSEKESQKEIRRVSSQGALPETWTWDGKQSRGDTAPVLTTYEYRLSVQLPNGLEIISGQELHKVEAQVYRGTGGLLNVIIPGILFDFNSTLLKSEMVDKLRLASLVLAEAGTAARMICEGHADEVGGDQENQKLSEQRAAMVAQCLHERLSVGVNRLSLRGFGQGRPVDDRGTEEARARNRRVELRVLVPMPAQ